MRALRPFPTGMAILSLVGGLSAIVVAQSDEEAIQPPTEFSGRLSCPVPMLPGEGTTTDVILGPMDEGDLIRRETRGSFFRPVVDGMSDPRFEGTWTAYLNTDEYIYPGVDMEDHPAVQAGTQRIENEEGAWQGSAPDAYVPGFPMTTWGLLVLTGEGAYAGLTAVQWTNLVDDTCACWEPDNLCQWDIRGFVFEGQMPPSPALGE